MDHPNIAKVLDAGKTDSGRPYFVMQLVNGVPITDYCDHCNLSIRERLTLFISVCHAVQHAHQKGIIHRDIKPTNVLIAMRDGRPEPRIIDFGVAKAINQRLTEQTLVTGFAQMLGTPLYMSPEQAELRPLEVDTRTDIYSLGVLLYELITGTTPFERSAMTGASYEEICRILRDQEPPKPSVRISTLAAEARTTVSADRCTDPQQLNQMIRGDLDWIAMKALEKDRTRRYETANGLALDIARYLNEEPVLACPPSATYRLRKFARRNKVLITSLVLIASVMLVATGVSTWMAVRESLARFEVENQRAEAEKERTSAAEQRDRAVRAEKQLDATVYAQKIALAYHELQAGHVDRARKLLSLCHPKYRHWEWHYLQQLCNSELVAIQAWHPYFFSAVAFSPNDDRVAVGTGVWNKTVVAVDIYDALSGRRLTKLQDHRNWRIEDVVFSKNGHRIASVSGFYDEGHRLMRPGQVKVSDVSDGGEKLLLEREGSIHAAVFDSDGQKLAWVTEDNTLLFWDLEADEELMEIVVDSVVYDIDLSESDEYLAAGCDDMTVKIWELKTGQLVQTLFGHTGPVLSVSFAPDGTRLASGSRDSTARVWDVASGKPAVTFARHDGPVHCVQFSPTGRRVASAGGNRHMVWSWDAITGEEAIAHRGHATVAIDLDYNADGSRMVACSADALKVWDQGRNTEVKELTRHQWWINAVAISPDNKLVVSVANDSTVKVCDAVTGELASVFRRHDGPVRNVLFTSDGKYVISSGRDGTVRIWDPHTAEELRCLEAHRGSSVKALALSPNDSRLVTGDDRGTVIVWEWTTGKELLRIDTHEHQLWSVDFDPGGQRIVTAGADGTPKIWNASTGELVRSLEHHAGTLRCAKFGTKNRLYVANELDRTIRLWDASSGKAIHTFEHTAKIFGFALSPDGRRLLAACSRGVLRVWDTETFEDLLCLPGSSDNYHYVTFSNNGLFVVAGGNDRRVRLWDATPLAESRVKRPLAVKTVVGLHAKLYLRDAVIEELLRPDYLPGDMRQLALDVAREIDEEPMSLNVRSWQVVTRRDGTADEYRLAARRAEQACRLSPDNWAFLTTLGAACYRVGRFELAIDVFAEAARVNPDGGHAYDWFVLSMCWYKRGDAMKARQCFDQAVRWWKARETLGANQVQELTQFWSEAVELLDLQLDERSFNPRKSLVLQKRGEQAFAREYWQEAADCFSKAMELGWCDRSMWTSGAIAHLLADDKPGYRLFCRQVWQQRSHADLATRAHIALICKLGANSVDDLDQLVALTEELVTVYPESARMRNHFAGVLYRAGRYDQALQQLKQNREVRDSIFDTLWLTLVQAQLKNIEAAETLLAKLQSSEYSTKNLELRVLTREAETLVRQERTKLVGESQRGE
jgi:WD40 repeat protein/tetratricopeptide (TPR) repeat protein